MSPEIPLIIASRAQIITKNEGGIKPPMAEGVRFELTRP